MTTVQGGNESVKVHYIKGEGVPLDFPGVFTYCNKEVSGDDKQEVYQILSSILSRLKRKQILFVHKKRTCGKVGVVKQPQGRIMTGLYPCSVNVT
jgi:hypothetical protein